MGLQIVDQINSPGQPGRRGDDRLGFDEAAGIAFVFDGATDVGAVRMMPKAESDAAWVAEALVSACLTTPAPRDGQVAAYFRTVLEAVRASAEKAVRAGLETYPADSLPIASGIWMQAEGDMVHLAWMGDCMALVGDGNGVELIGSDGRADLETETARRMAEMSAEDKRAELRRIRGLQNTVPEHKLFGLQPEAVDNLETRSVPTQEGLDLVLMTDGLYRLINPYALHDPDSLMALIRTDGLSGAIDALRRFEAEDRDASARIKARDDACAVWVRID